MNNKELEKFEPKKLFEEFINDCIGYIEKENIRKIFYSIVYLLYLAKKNNLKLKTECYNDYFEKIEEKSISLKRLLEKLSNIYSNQKDITKEYLILKDIKELFEINIISKEFNDKLFDNMVKLTEKLTEKDFLDIFSNNSLEYTKYSGKEYNATPNSIVELVSWLLDIKNNEDILDLCSGNGDFLSNLAKYNENVKLNGIEIDKDIALISKIRLSVLSDNNAEIIVNDALTYDFNKKFDKIFCEYPLGLKVNKFKLNKQNNNLFYSWNKTGLTSDWMFLNKIITLLKPNGIAVLIIKDGPLFKAMDIECRKDILVSGVVKYIIKLPVGILQNSNISSNLVVLSKSNEKNEIKFIDATQEYIENKQKEKQLNISSIMNLVNNTNNNNDKVNIKKNSDILLSEDVLLNVNSYVKKREANYINPHLLKEFIIDKYRGYQFSLKEQSEIENPKGDYNLLTISNINDGMISDNLIKINSNNNKYDRYLLKDGDIVITSKGTKIKVAVANIKGRKIIPNGNLLVLRLDTNKINPYYLEAFLNSANGRLSLEEIQTGAVIISINPSRIEQMKVSIIDKEAQEIFVKKYKRKMTELILAQEHVKKLKEQINNMFINEIEENQDNE